MHLPSIMLKRCIFVSTFENASLFKFASFLAKCVFVSISVVFARVRTVTLIQSVSRLRFLLFLPTSDKTVLWHIQLPANTSPGNNLRTASQIHRIKKQSNYIKPIDILGKIFYNIEKFPPCNACGLKQVIHL